MSNVDINVDRRTDGRTDGRTENRTPISHPATSRCDNEYLATGDWSQSILHYENTPIQIYGKVSPPKTESFQLKTLIFFKYLLKT